LGDVFAAAIATAISPVPIVAVILVLFGAHARRNGIFFLLGWVLGLLAVIGLILLVPDDFGLKPRDWVATAGAALRLVFGSFFVGAAFMIWMRRPKHGEERPIPAWASRIANVTAIQALLLAIGLAVVNPKNVVLALSLMVTLLEAQLSPRETRLAVACFVAVGSLTIAVPVFYRLIAGKQADRHLQEWKEWLIHNKATVMFVLLLVMGTIIFGRGVGGLL
jgi:threonine/homoserine/homoserine lactone efflux protein